MSPRLSAGTDGKTWACAFLRWHEMGLDKGWVWEMMNSIWTMLRFLWVSSDEEMGKSWTGFRCSKESVEWEGKGTKDGVLENTEI